MAPPGGRPVPIASYERNVRGSLARVWENVHDWEHLPWLHRSTFRSIELLASGTWGWHARVGLRADPTDRATEIELRVEEEDRYVVRTLAGTGEGTEIHTTLAARGPADTAVAVEFLVPGLDRAHAEGLGAAYTALYTRLWDEDEAMIRERSRQLARRAPRPETSGRVALGQLGSLPRVVEAFGRRYRIVACQDELLVHGVVCPHRLGPLDDACVEEGAVRCPWHGYRFDLRTGADLDGRRLRLPPAPRLERDARGEAWLVFGPESQEVTE